MIYQKIIGKINEFETNEFKMNKDVLGIIERYGGMYRAMLINKQYRLSTITTNKTLLFNLCMYNYRLLTDDDYMYQHEHRKIYDLKMKNVAMLPKKY